MTPLSSLESPDLTGHRSDPLLPPPGAGLRLRISPTGPSESPIPVIFSTVRPCAKEVS